MTGKPGEEIAWWDYWNTHARTTAFKLDSSAGRTGLLALEEIRRLQLQSPSVLEVGCGTGWLAEQIADAARYVGLDLSPAAVETARQRVPGAEFLSADYHTWSCEPASFDVVVMVDTIAYFRDQDAAVAKAWNALRPGGRLIVTTVNPIVFSRLSSVGPPGKGQVRKWLSRTALRDLLQRNGFALERSYTVFPAGDRGFLRVLNSRKIAVALFGGEYPKWITRCKERLGLGQYRIAVARRPSDGS